MDGYVEIGTLLISIFIAYGTYLWKARSFNAKILMISALVAIWQVICIVLALQSSTMLLPAMLIEFGFLILTIEMVHRIWRSSSGIKGISLAELVEQLPGHVYCKDIHGIYGNCNRLQRENLGGPQKEGDSDYDFLPKEVADGIKVVDANVVRTGKYEVIEETGFLNGENTDRFYLSHKTPLVNRCGKIVGLVGLSVEITEAKKDIVERVNILENVIGVMPASIYWMNRDGVYLGCNDINATFAKLESRHEIIGKRNSDLSLDTRGYDIINEQVMVTGKAVTLEEPLMLGNNLERVILSTKTPLLNKNNEVIGLIGVSIDITERKAMEEELKATRDQLEEANIVKSEFIANMSHDLRTPITGIIGMAERLSREDSKEARQQSAKLLTSACDDLLGLLNDFIDVAQAEAGSGMVMSKSFDLHEMLSSCVRLSGPAAKDKNLRLQLECDTNLPQWVVGDARRIGKILSNLLSNAVKFTPKGEVNMGAYLAKDSPREVVVKFVVRDTGIGIPEDKQEIIFTRFRRLTASYQGLYKGSGVGLSIVRQFIDDLDGEIQVQSQPNHGSTFTCLIPFKKPLLEDEILEIPQERLEVSEVLVDDQDAPLTQPASASTHAIRVLLVEDNLLAQTVGRGKLTDLGCHVQIVDSGEEAIERATAGKAYDLILMDIGLPGKIDGCEATTRIRAWESEHQRHTPIVALTAHGDQASDRQRCFEAGMENVLSKPLTPEKAFSMLCLWVARFDGKL